MDSNNYETEEQKKDRIRKEILDELNDNGHKSNRNINGVAESFAPPKPESRVSFNKKEEDINKSDDVGSNLSNNNKGTNKVLLLVCGIFVIIVVIFFPTISKKIDKYRNSRKRPSIDVEEVKEKEYEKLTLESEVVNNVKYPIMHIDNGSKTTYYNKDKVSISDFSNNDILYNAIADAYEGNMAKYTGKYSGSYCGSPTNKVSIDARYLKLRIENLYNKKTQYTLSDFTVPVNSNKTKYIGTWKYDKSTNRYIYYGDCSKTNGSNILYYDINVPYEADSSDKNIELYLYNYVVFASVNKLNGEYTIYSDYKYTNEITKGKLTTTNYEKELTSVVKNMAKDKVNKYKYTFSVVNCAYQDYCFVSGEWVK